MRLIRQTGVILLTLTLLLVQGGCGLPSRLIRPIQPPLPRPLLPEMRAQLGRVGVVSGGG